MDGARDGIARIEEEIERLNGTLESCRKVSIGARAAIAIGAVWLAALIVGLVRPDAVALLGSTALILGGIVAYGSNSTTAQQTEGQIAQAQAQRNALIGEIELTLVPEPSPTLH